LCKLIFCLEYICFLNSSNEIQEEEIKNADLLNESIFDIIKRTFKKAINWIKSFFQKIYSFVSKSYKSLMEFMVIEPVVKYNNMVKW